MATDAFSSRSNCRIYCVAFLPRGHFPAFVPIPAEYKSKQGEDATRVFVAYVSGLLTLAPGDRNGASMLAAPPGDYGDGTSALRSADKFALDHSTAAVLPSRILLISPGLAKSNPQYLEPKPVPAFAPTFLISTA